MWLVGALFVVSGDDVDGLNAWSRLRKSMLQLIWLSVTSGHMHMVFGRRCRFFGVRRPKDRQV